MAVEVTYVQDNFLTSDVLNEMVKLQADIQSCRETVADAAAPLPSTDAAGGLLQGSSRPHPVQPVLVSGYHHVGQDQGNRRLETRGRPARVSLTSARALLQGSLSCHAPKDQAYSQILEHVYSQLGNMH